MPGGPDALTTVRGQVEVATTDGAIDSIALEPARPPALPEAVPRSRDADWVVLGPGSWFTSVIPHLLVPELREALVQTDARLVVVLNLEPTQAGETHGFAPEDHLAVLAEHAPDLRSTPCWPTRGTAGDADELAQAVAGVGAELVVRRRRRGRGSSPRQIRSRLAEAYARICRASPGRRC